MQCWLRIGMTAALGTLAGCQSYFPSGYGYMDGGYSYGNTYPAMTAPAPYPSSRPGMMPSAPPGAYGPRPLPPAGIMQPTPLPSGPTNSATLPPVGNPPQKLVPDPIEPLPNGPSANGQPPASPARPPNSLGNALDDEDDLKDLKKPVGSNPAPEIKSSSLLNDSEENVRKFGPEEFSTPKTVPVGKKSAEAQGASFESSDPAEMPRPDPYAFDRKGYAWLRGVLDYDQVDKKWHITYSNELQDGDTYGGSLTLLEDDSLDMRITNDVVLIEGKIDTSRRDRFGKPMYRIRKLDPLRPAAAHRGGKQP